MKDTLSLILVLLLLLIPHFNSCHEQKADGRIKYTRLLILVLTTNNAHHITYGKMTKAFIESQKTPLKDKLDVGVILTHEEWPDLMGAWTILPLISEIKEYYKDFHWIFFIQDYTEIKLPFVYRILQKYNPLEHFFIGRALRDQKPTIIHHFAFINEPSIFAYPDFGSGVLMSRALIEHLSTESYQIKIGANFAIDPKHELAMLIYKDGNGLNLTETDLFCSPDQSSADCASYYNTQSLVCPSSSVHSAVTDEQIFVMVKTCEKFHKDRVPLQKRLWTARIKNLEYCSETLDKTIPTVRLKIQNTETGHCGKLYAILQRAYKEKHINSKNWLIVVDDDTIMSIPRLLKVLSCYKPTDAVVLGERYGYSVQHGGGYDYVTGGGGIVLSKQALKEIVESGVRCSSDNDPDDMMLGVWLRRLVIPVVHSPLFHQAGPNSYAPEYINHQKDTAVSFHKFSDEPETVAKEWLGLTLWEEGIRDEL